MGLKLSELPANEEIFIDANIFLYSAFKHPVFGNNCKTFLIGIEKEEIKGYTSDFVLNEVFHKLMIAEVVKKFGIAAKQVVRFVKKKPEAIAELETVWTEMEILKGFNISILNSSLCHDEKPWNNKHSDKRPRLWASGVAQGMETLKKKGLFA